MIVSADQGPAAGQCQASAAHRWRPGPDLVLVVASSAATNPVGSGMCSMSDSGPAGSVKPDSARVRRAKVTQNRISSTRYGCVSALPRQSRSFSVEAACSPSVRMRPGPAIAPIPAVRISGRNVPDWLLIQQYEYTVKLPPQSRPFDSNARDYHPDRARRCATSGLKKGLCPAVRRYRP
jgi:hypothetical protein